MPASTHTKSRCILKEQAHGFARSAGFAVNGVLLTALAKHNVKRIGTVRLPARSEWDRHENTVSRKDTARPLGLRQPGRQLSLIVFRAGSRPYLRYKAALEHALSFQSGILYALPWHGLTHLLLKPPKVMG